MLDRSRLEDKRSEVKGSHGDVGGLIDEELSERGLNKMVIIGDSREVPSCHG